MSDRRSALGLPRENPAGWELKVVPKTALLHPCLPLISAYVPILSLRTLPGYLHSDSFFHHRRYPTVALVVDNSTERVMLGDSWIRH